MLCLFAVFAFSCNEDMERLLTDDYPESGTEYTTGHVLMVVIDGASGIAVNEAYNTRKAPVIRSMTDKSLFTFYGLADNEEGVSKERGWANLLTGTTKNGVRPGGQTLPRTGKEAVEAPVHLRCRRVGTLRLLRRAGFARGDGLRRGKAVRLSRQTLRMAQLRADRVSDIRYDSCKRTVVFGSRGHLSPCFVRSGREMRLYLLSGPDCVMAKSASGHSKTEGCRFSVHGAAPCTEKRCIQPRAPASKKQPDPKWFGICR